MRFLPILNTLRRATGRTKPLQEVASDVTVLHPEEVETWDPVTFLNGQLEKATAAPLA